MRRTILLSVALIVAGFSRTQLDTVDAQSISGTATAVVRLISVRADGSEGGAAGTSFEAGESGTAFLFAGDLNSLCSHGMSSSGRSSIDDLVAQHDHVWRVTGTAFPYSDGKMRVDLDWSRFARSSAEPVAGGTEQLSLLEGQRYVLDFLRAPLLSDTCEVTSIVVQVAGGMRDDVVASDRQIEYELWLVHTDPSGSLQSRRIITTGAHGMEVPFSFRSFRFPVPRISADQDDFEVASRVSGRLRGRLEPDGSIAVELFSNRGDELGRRGGTFFGGIGGEGRKVMRLAPSDTIEIEMPATSGLTSQFASSQAAAAGSNATTRLQGSPGPPASVPPPVAIIDGRIRVAFRSFFEGHRLALLIQARAIG